MDLSTQQINTDAGHLGGKVGFIFFVTGSIAAIGGWYLYPETKVWRDHLRSKTVRLWLTKMAQGISFEMMDQLYASMTAPRHFSRAVTAQSETTPYTCKTEVSEHVEGTNSSS